MEPDSQGSADEHPLAHRHEPAARVLPRWGEVLLLLHLAGLAAMYVATNRHVQPALTPDMGRDLFAYSRVATGEIPYADFHWIYGPLMPYVFGAAFRVFGASVCVARDSYVWLVVLGAGVAWLAARPTLGATGAHVAAALTLFWGGPPHSYNQVGLLATSAAACFFLLRGIAAGPGVTGARVTLAGLLVACWLSGLVKLNAGLAWIAVAFLMRLVDLRLREQVGARRSQEGRAIVIAVVLATVALGSVYLALLWGVPAPHRALCFNVGSFHGNRESILESFTYVFRTFGSGTEGGSDVMWAIYSRACIVPWLFLLAVLAGAGRLLWAVARRQAWNSDLRRLLALWVAVVLLTHEFYVNGSGYALFDLPLVPLLLLLLALLTEVTARLAWARTRAAIAMALAGWLLVSSGQALANRSLTRALPAVPLTTPRGGGVLLATPGDRECFDGVATLLRHITVPGEPVPVLNYDPGLSFLADRPSPIYPFLVRAFEFEAATEEELMRALDREDVRCAVVTNTAISMHPADGCFGFTHLERLAAHFAERFEPVAYFGRGPWMRFSGRPDSLQAVLYWKKGVPKPPDLSR